MPPPFSALIRGWGFATEDWQKLPPRRTQMSTSHGGPEGPARGPEGPARASVARPLYLKLLTRHTIKLGTRQTNNATHKTAIMHWKSFSAGGIPLLQCINKGVILARPACRAEGPPCGPEGPAAGPKGPHAGPKGPRGRA